MQGSSTGYYPEAPSRVWLQRDAQTQDSLKFNRGVRQGSAPAN